MAQKDISTLRTQAQEIRDETTANANTAARVGGMHEDQNDSALNVVETSSQQVVGNIEFLANVLADKLAADVATQLNTGDFGGAVAIGSGFGGISTAPLDGMIVEGDTLFGVSSTVSGARLTVRTLTSPGNSKTVLRLEHNSSVVGTGINIDVRIAGSEAVTTRIGSIIESDASRSMFFSTLKGALAERMRITGDGIGVGLSIPLAQFDIKQPSVTGAKPALKLTQADLSEEMIKFDATIGVGNPIEAIGAKSFTPTQYIKCSIEGVGEGYLQFGTIA